MGDIDGELRFEILQGMVKINWAPEDGTLILEDSDSEYENRPVSDSQAISSCDRKQVKVVEHHSLTASSVQNISREIQGAIPDMQENDAQQFGMHAKKHNGRKINDQKSNTVVEHMPVHDDIPDIDSEPDDMGPSTNSKSLSYPSSVVQSNVLIEDDLQRKQQTQEQCKPVALFTGLTDLHSRITVPFTPYCICYTPGTLPVGQRPTLVVHATDFQALYHSVMAGTFTDESSSFLSSSSSSSTIVSAGASKDYQGEDKQQDSLEHELEEKPTFLPVCEKKEVAHVRRLLSLTHVKYIPGGKHGVWTVEEMAKFRKKDVRKLLGDDFVDHHEPSVLGTGVEHLVKWWSARSKYFKVVPPILLAALFVGWMLGCTIYQYTVCLYPHEIRCESIPFASVPEPTTALDGNTSTTPTAVASISASEKPAAADAGAMVTTITSIALARPTSDVMVRDRYTEVGLFGRSTADLHKGMCCAALLDILFIMYLSLSLLLPSF
ncbi:uncharacterized protein EV422DRAFT_195032 [Fimicolochytrium jonesii]|uniref:uncharacterized protein n=1 Tax=Fimicolochytrium jonesii TaxID=1396493 RepID=UPI0022FF3CC2|nr:uncharacterized protein EV422DRAFT_195032 [Fimicolochytrium jonesii]KAI8818229.1 hypothetical protein EV422DRAFT_195032 [Fimicolochytrium jonesii]